jgi:hypothetical protein
LDEEQMDHLIGDVLLKGHYARHYPLNFHTLPLPLPRSRQILSDISDWLAPSENQAQRVVILGTPGTGLWLFARIPPGCSCLTAWGYIVSAGTPSPFSQS